MEENNKRLQELKGSDYKIVDDQPDIKGWPLYTADHQKLGEVEDLLFDPQLRKVRYIIADLDGKNFDMDDKEVLIPIGIAELHEKDDEVILPGVTIDNLRALPEYNDERDLSDADEQAILKVLSGGATGAYSGSIADRYSHTHFDDQNLYRNRNRQLINDDTNRVMNDDIDLDNEGTGRSSDRLNMGTEDSLEDELRRNNSDLTKERRVGDRPSTGDSFREAEL